MSNFLESKLFPIIDRGGVLVFPTEESARSVSVEYVLSKKKGIFKDRCISFDTFSENYYPSEGKNPVSDFDRTIFAYSFIENMCEDLEYIYNPKYPEMKSFLPSYIKSLLADLDSVSEDELANKELLGDLLLIKREYKRFLLKNNLYDIGYLRPAFPPVDGKEYYLVTPDIYPKEAKMLKRLSGSERLKRVETEPVKAPLQVFEEEKAEIRNLFIKIRNLVDSGVGMESIAISASGFDRIKPFLLQESKLFDVPLSFMKGDSILSSVPGLLLKRLESLYEDRFRIEDMKAFFLEPSFEFDNKDEIRAFIIKSIQLSIVSAVDGNEDRFLKLSSPDRFNYYKFKAALEKLMKERVPSRVASELIFLLDFLLGSEYFKNNDSDNKCMGMIQSHLAVFLDAVKRASDCGYEIEAPLFPIFLKALDGVSYVENAVKEGIRVYPFSQSASIPYDHHFIISLNEKESSKVIRDGDFLSDYERAGLDDGAIITDSLVSSYVAFNENLYLSCSRSTSAGAELPLAYLSECEVESKLEAEDSWRIESTSDRHGKMFKLQREGYEKAKTSSLKSIQDDVRSMPALEHAPELSFTNVTAYEKCPFYYALEYEYGLKNLPAYDISKMDKKELGNRIHSIMERFFRYDGHNPKENLKKYFDEEMEAWKNALTFDYDKATGIESTRNMDRGSASATDSLVQYVQGKFYDNLVEMAEFIAEESEPYEDGLEMKLRADFAENGFSLKGFADKVAVDKESGNLIIYDYKTGKKFDKKDIPEKQLQFFIYRFILEKQGEKVDKGQFLFLRDNKREEVLEGKGPEEESGEFKRLLSAAEGIRSGNRSLTESFDNCKGCVFKAICRRNMAVR